MRENRRGILTQMKLNLNIKVEKFEKSNDTMFSYFDITKELTNITLDLEYYIILQRRMMM